MARSFNRDEWEKIHRLLDERGEELGLPMRREGSVVLGSFNIRKLGARRKKSGGTWRMLGAIAERFDLLAIQEVQDDLGGLKHIHRELLGDRYGLVASDITGSYPGARPAPERLAFLFRWDRVRRTEIASDITYDRSRVFETLYDSRFDFLQSCDTYTHKLAEWETIRRTRKRKPTRPKLHLNRFLTFIRQPLCVSFEVRGEALGGSSEKDAPPYEFLAVNAHLLYGTDPLERQLEFEALIAWMVDRARQVDRLYHKNLVLLGDLNLDFEAVDKRRVEIEAFLKSLNSEQLTGTGAEVNFPFLDVHPGSSEVFRTNARLSQTYDQVALLSHDPRLPMSDVNPLAGQTGPDGYDYGVFNFVELFREALELPPVAEMSSAEKKDFFSKFEHDFTDHMPIWIRLPKPAG
jgi:endonuclease/exonuclease/phosphatase family metal-dependent hydrolase